MNIDDCIRIVVDRLKNEKLILFVGAGLSRESGLPDWKKLFEPYSDKLSSAKEDTYPDLATAIISKNIYTRGEIIDHIVEKISNIDFELNKNHYLIKRLPFNIILTTNYDNILEDLYVPTKLKRIYTDNEMSRFDHRSSKIQLIYLHGDINHAEQMVVTSIDYQNYSDTHPRMVQRLKTLLQDYTFLFIGYSASDPNLLAVIDHFRLTHKEGATRHFIVLADPLDVKRLNLRVRYGIEPIILEHHSELTPFLERLNHTYKNPEQTAIHSKAVTEEESTFSEAIEALIKSRFEEKVEQARVVVPVDFTLKKPFNVPREDPHFTGRDTEISLLKDELLGKKVVSVTGLFGMGGIGKTSLAKHVAHKLHKEGFFKDGICWHRLEGKGLFDSLAEIADFFGAFWLREIPTPEVRFRRFQTIIQDLDILIILDNAEYIENIPPLLNFFRNHPVLITSRRRLSGLTDVLDISRLDETKSLELFLRTWKQEDDEPRIRNLIDSFSDSERNALSSICNELLGGLPLALAIAANVLRVKKMDIPGFAELLNEKKLSLLQDPNNVYSLDVKDKDVRLSFDLSFEQLQPEGTARSVFSVMGIFGGEDFSKDALYEIFHEQEKTEIDTAVETLRELSIVQEREKRLYLHPLLRQYALEKLPEFKGDVAYEKMVVFYVKLVKDDPKALSYEWKNALNAANWCLDHEKEKDGLFLILKIDRFLYETGKWTIREEWLKKGIEVADRIEDATNYYNFNSRLEDLYGRQHKIKERGKIINNLLDYCIRFKTLQGKIPWVNYLLAKNALVLHEPMNSYHINVKNIKNSIYFNKKEALGAVYKNIGNLFKKHGFYEQALLYYKSNLIIKEKYGVIENKIRAIDDIADVYLALERYDKALAWYQKYENELSEYQDKELEVILYINYINYFIDTDDVKKAGVYLEKYKTAIDELGDVTSSAKVNYYEGLLEKAKGNHNQAISLLNKAVQLYTDIEREDENGDCYYQIGICHLKLGNIRKARENFNYADNIFKKYQINPLSRCYMEAYSAFLDAKSAYDVNALRLFNRAKNTLTKIGVERSKDLDEIEHEIRVEINDEKFQKLFKELKESENADETIDLGGDYLHIGPIDKDKEIASPIDGRKMALISSGFIESAHYQHALYLYPFYMDNYPVTNRDYKKFVDDMDIEPPLFWNNGKIPEGMEEHPVAGITYDDALAYAQWADKDLPLQEEWEKAAGIGTGFKYPWGNEIKPSHSYFISPKKEDELIEEKSITNHEVKEDIKLQSPLLPDDQLHESDLITGGDDHHEILNVKIAPHSLKFDEKYFLELLANAISLTKKGKLNLIESIPKFTQYQADTYISIFEKESLKLKHLNYKNKYELNKSETLASPLMEKSELQDDQFVTGGDDHSIILKMEIPPHQLNFNEQHFLELLSNSISLARKEKLRIVASIPKLSQYQIDDLIRIFTEEFMKLPGNKYKKEVTSANKNQQEILRDSPGKIKTYPVLKYDENKSPYGIRDLLGNLFEYTTSLEPLHRNSSLVVIKGFSWLRNSIDNNNEITGKHYSFVNNRWADVGFRCVKRIYGKNDVRKFIEPGNRKKDWKIKWFFDRAEYYYDILKAGLLTEDVEAVVEKGMMYCKKLLALAPEHKKGVYLLIRIQTHGDENLDFKNLFENNLYALVEKYKFKREHLHEIFSDIAEAKKDDNIIARHDKLLLVIEKIDSLLHVIENDLMSADFRLAQRNTLASLDYLLNRYEEKFTFLQYTLILFLCLMKIKLSEFINSLKKIEKVSATLVTRKIEKGQEGIIAFKINNQGLAMIKDIIIELSDEKPTIKSKPNNFSLSQDIFRVARLGGNESRIFETAVKTVKTGVFPFYMAVLYTNPEAEEEMQDRQLIFEKQIEVETSTPVESKQNVIFVNPYCTGRPIQSPEMFFGRNDVLERIKQRLGPNNIIILYGQRRTGKTSTLFQLKNVVYKDTAVPVFLTMQSMLGSDRSFFFFRTAREIYDAIRYMTDISAPNIDDYKSDPQYAFELFIKKATMKVKEKPIILMIDEFDGLFQMIKENRMEPSVLDNLRSIMQHYQQIWFLLAGTHMLKQAASDYKSALFNIATYEKISTLDENSARDLIVKPIKEHIEYEPYVVDKLISLTNGHPYFIQGICYELVYFLESRQKQSVTLKDFNFVITEFLQQGSSHFDNLWGYLPENERLFLSLLVENIHEYELFASLDRARDFCKGKFKPEIDVYQLIYNLKEKDLIIERKYMEKRYVGMFMNLFKDWISLHHPPNTL
jgi:formylglycine-generating enzyme required for sulfatase activity